MAHYSELYRYESGFGLRFQFNVYNGLDVKYNVNMRSASTQGQCKLPILCSLEKK